MTDKLSTKKPPLGLVPRNILYSSNDIIYYRTTDIERFDDVCAAIIRYVNAKLSVPKEWYEEYNYLLQKITI
jgi:hypothetical protein